MRLNEATVSIVGLGLMGGSLGLALEGRCARRIGVARREETAQEALLAGAVDEATTSLREGVAGAHVVVLATPVRSILSLVGEVGSLMPPGSLLIDLGSTKAEIVRAMNQLPENILAVGGHPMCGKEVGGIAEAEAGLYRGATFALCPTARATEREMSLGAELAEAIGARPLIIEAEQHDRAVAFVSHLPYLLSAALVQTEKEAEAGDPVLALLAASGFRDTTRLAASEVPMMLDILLTNHEYIEAALLRFERHIAEARELLNNPPQLEKWMAQSQAARREMFRCAQ